MTTDDTFFKNLTLDREIVFFFKGLNQVLAPAFPAVVLCHVAKSIWRDRGYFRFGDLPKEAILLHSRDLSMEQINNLYNDQGADNPNALPMHWEFVETRSSGRVCRTPFLRAPSSVKEYQDLYDRAEAHHNKKQSTANQLTLFCYAVAFVSLPLIYAGLYYMHVLPTFLSALAIYKALDFVVLLVKHIPKPFFDENTDNYPSFVGKLLTGAVLPSVVLIMLNQAAISSFLMAICPSVLVGINATVVSTLGLGILPAMAILSTLVLAWDQCVRDYLNYSSSDAQNLGQGRNVLDYDSGEEYLSVCLTGAAEGPSA